MTSDGVQLQVNFILLKLYSRNTVNLDSQNKGGISFKIFSNVARNIRNSITISADTSPATSLGHNLTVSTGSELKRSVDFSLKSDCFNTENDKRPNKYELMPTFQEGQPVCPAPPTPSYARSSSNRNLTPSLHAIPNPTPQPVPLRRNSFHNMRESSANTLLSSRGTFSTKFLI